MMSALSDDSDETLKNLRRQNIAGAVMEHHRYRAEIDKANLRLSRIYTVIVIIVASGIICAVVAYWRRRNLRLQRLVDEYMAMINDFTRAERERGRAEARFFLVGAYRGAAFHARRNTDGERAECCLG